MRKKSSYYRIVILLLIPVFGFFSLARPGTVLAAEEPVLEGIPVDEEVPQKPSGEVFVLPGEEEEAPGPEEQAIAVPEEAAADEPLPAPAPAKADEEAQAAVGLEVTANIRIAAGAAEIWQGEITTDGCTVTDNGGVDHKLFGPKALCALDQASILGGFDYTLINGAWGLYLDEVAGYKATATDFWLYRVNWQMPWVGLDQYDLAEGDDLLLFYGPWPGMPLRVSSDKATANINEDFTLAVEYYDDQITFAWQPSPDTTVDISGHKFTTNSAGQVTLSWPSAAVLDIFAYKDDLVRSDNIAVNITDSSHDLAPVSWGERKRAANLALNYLQSVQGSEGRIENAGVSAWAAMAFGSGGINPAAVSNQQSLLDYLATYQGPANARDLARHVLAIVASGQDPYSFSGRNWVEDLKNYFDGNQIDDINLINDDIFAVLALVGAGEDTGDSIIQKSLDFITSHQNADGGWSYGVGLPSDVDTTAAAIQALAASHYGSSAAFTTTQKARDFLWASQNNDGGFPYSSGQNSNSASTAWAIQALTAIGENIHNWAKDNKATPFHFLLSLQQNNGSFSWEKGSSTSNLMTAYAVPALLGQPLPVLGGPSWTWTPAGGAGLGQLDLAASSTSAGENTSANLNASLIAAAENESLPEKVGQVLGAFRNALFPNTKYRFIIGPPKNWRRQASLFGWIILFVAAGVLSIRIFAKEKIRRIRARN